MLLAPAARTNVILAEVALLARLIIAVAALGPWIFQARVGGGEGDVVYERVGAGIHVDDVARAGVVLREYGLDVGQRGIGGLAGVGVVADGGGEDVSGLG